MNRRLFLATAALLLCALPALSHAQTSPTSLDLTILHNNDVHGHILPFAYTEPERSKFEQASVGGAARRATLIRELKRRSKNPIMAIDLGDIGTRGPMTNVYEGEADIEVMNAIGYDLAVIGNNEFKFKDGIERAENKGAQRALMNVIRRSKFPWVCANAGEVTDLLSVGGTVTDLAQTFSTTAKTFLPGVAPFVVREINGVKVGFLGLTAPRSASYPQTVGWWVGDPVVAAKKWIPIMRNEAGCDVVIALTHIGTDDDKKLAQETTGIDAIIGGDSHTFLYKPEVVNGIPIVQTGEFGVNLGKFDLHFEKTNSGWKLGSYKYVLMPITGKIKEASDVKAIADRYAKPLMVNIGKIDQKLIGKTPEERIKLTAQTTVDALQKGTGADVSLTNPGDGMFDVFRTQQISLYDLRAVWPFKNNVATVRLTGAEIEALKKKVRDTVQSSNMLVLEMKTTYTVALIDFVATGTYEITKDRLTDTGRDMRDVVIAGLK
jgi:2',3'-cyclic-nucleotide 2'-phosphodiesterase (5'-nucleotidase family)